MNEITSLETAASLLDELARSAGGSETDDQAERVMYATASLEVTEPAQLSRFMERYLLPRCLEERGPTDDARAGRMRELLRDWLESLPEEALWQVRHRLLVGILEHIRRNPTQAGIYCLASIGYRSYETIRALKEVAERDDECGDEALRLLCGLQPSATDMDWIKRRLRQRIAVRSTEGVLDAVAMTGSGEWIDRLADDAIGAEHPLRELSRLTWFAAGVPIDRDLHDCLWAAVLRIAGSKPHGWAHVLFTGSIVQHIISPKVIPGLVGALPEISQLGPIHVLRWAERLQEAESPVQISGWAKKASADVVSILKRYCTRSSGQEGSYLTTDAHIKQQAVDTLLCLGEPAVFDADAIVSQEANAYVQNDMMRRLAVLSLPSLPSTVSDVLKGATEFASNSTKDELLAFLGAASLAASSMNVEALDLLMTTRGVMEGHPFVEPVHRAAEQAEWLIRQGVSRAMELVRRNAEDGQGTGKSIAFRTFLLLAERGRCPSEVVGMLMAVAEDSRCPPYVRRDAIGALAYAEAESSESGVRAVLHRVAATADVDTRLAAIEALIVSARDTAGNDVRTHIEREVRDQLKSGGISAEVANLVGQLLSINGGVDVACAVEVAQRASPSVAEALLDGFRARVSAAQWLPDSVAKIIVERVQRGETSSKANPPLVRALALVAPGPFLDVDWQAIWDRWMPDSRQALADVMPDMLACVSEESSARGRAVAWLERLLGDSVFAVRRSAARSLAMVALARLESWCALARESGSIELRRRAAEAAAWLPLTEEGVMDSAMLRAFAEDSERVVRQAAERARIEARRRVWSAELLEMIDRPHDDSNAWVLGSYAAGNALARIGDDRDLGSLERRAADPAVPPNVRYWFARVATQLERQWRTTTREWPQPWLPWRGSIEEVEGELIVGDRACATRFSLWQRSAAGKWGGAARFDNMLGFRLMGRATEHAVVLLSDGREGKAVITEMTGNQAILLGSGPYPEPQSLG